MAALAPIPRASVRITVVVRPFMRTSERNAYASSCRNPMDRPPDARPPPPTPPGSPAPHWYDDRGARDSTFKPLSGGLRTQSHVGAGRRRAGVTSVAGFARSAAASEEELAGGRVQREADRTVVGGGRLGGPAHAAHEMRAHRPVRLVDGGERVIDLVGHGQPVRGPLRLRHGGRLRDPRTERRRKADEVVVEDDDGGPVGAAALDAFGVDRLDRGLELEPPGASGLWRRGRAPRGPPRGGG